MSIQSFKQFAARHDYAFDCPEMEFIGRLDGRAWGKGGNLFLYVSEVSGPGRYCLSVWCNDDYQGREGGINFKDAAELGGHYRLRVRRTASGRADLAHGEAVVSALG